MVRAVRPDELEEAGEVTAASYREFVRESDDDWHEYLERLADVAGRVERTRVLVAVEDGRILGTATLELTGRVGAEDEPLGVGEAHVRMLGVHPEARHRGIARMLMLACIDEAKGSGKRRLTLHTTRRMRAAQALYGSMGFRRVADRVFPDGFVLLGYELSLDEA